MAKRIARLEKKNRFVILENGNECQILVLRIQPSSEIRRMYVNREKKKWERRGRTTKHSENRRRRDATAKSEAGKTEKGAIEERQLLRFQLEQRPITVTIIFAPSSGLFICLYFGKLEPKFYCMLPPYYIHKIFLKQF